MNASGNRKPCACSIQLGAPVTPVLMTESAGSGGSCLSDIVPKLYAWSRLGQPVLSDHPAATSLCKRVPAAGLAYRGARRPVGSLAERGLDLVEVFRSV